MSIHRSMVVLGLSLMPHCRVTKVAQTVVTGAKRDMACHALRCMLTDVGPKFGWSVKVHLKVSVFHCTAVYANVQENTGIGCVFLKKITAEQLVGWTDQDAHRPMRK